MNSIRKFLLPAMVALQLLIIAGMLAKAMLPLYTGREITVAVEGRDPRDLFRGSYVALNYSFSTVHLDSLANDIPDDASYHFGDQLFLELRQSGELWQPVGLWQTAPEEGRVFLKGTVRHTYNGGQFIYLNFGIESYFTTPAQARFLEKQLQTPAARVEDEPLATVSLMVAPDGTSRITNISLSGM